mgnify:FL=1
MANSQVILLPVYRGVIQATIDKGHRWSDIEHLVLIGLAQNDYTLSDLECQSNLPSEVLLEAINRLMRAGWVEINETADRITFRATSSGLVEADKDTLSSIPREHTRKLHFIVERLGNTVLSSRDCVLLKENKAKRLLAKNKDDPPLVLPVYVFDNDLPTYSEIVEPLLARDEEFVTYNSEKSWLSSDFYAKVIVTGEEIEGLPDNASASLKSLLLAAAGSVSTSKLNADVLDEIAVQSAEKWQECAIELDTKDLCIGGVAHEELFDRLLRNARRRVIIHSTFLGDKALARKLDVFADAVKQGAEIDILWDRAETNAAGKTLRVCRELIKGRGLENQVRVQPTSTGSHAKLLVADDGLGEYVAVVGSCNWLLTGFNSVEISVCFRDRQIVFDCLGILEKLIHRPRFRDVQLRADIVALRNQIKPLEEYQNSPVTARLLSNGCHEKSIELARDTAQRDIFIASHKLGGPVETQMLIPLVSAVKARGVDVNVYYQKQTGPAKGEAVRNALKEKYTNSFQLKQIDAAHAKFLCWDDDHVVITSLNWLSKDIDNQMSLGEVGVYLKGPGLAKYVKEAYLSDYS